MRAARHILHGVCRAGACWLAWIAPGGVGLAAVLNGPYVLLEESNVLRIRFETDRLDYQIALQHDDGSRTRVEPAYRRGPRDTFLAEARVSLASAQPFRGYEVGRPGEPVASYDWRSRINGMLQGPPRLLVFGDSQGGSRTLRELGRQWHAEDFDLIVGLGDLADAGSRYESWREEFFEPLRDVLPHWPFLAVCGNHDSYREKSLGWFDWYFGRVDGRRYARIDFDDLRLVVLNNSDVHTKYGFDPIDPLTPQYDFLLESVLGATAWDKRIAVFCHVPIVSGSTVVNREFGSLLQRKYVLPMLERAPVVGFFAGHHHKYERVALPGVHGTIQHIVTGGGGGRLFTTARERGGFKMDREIFEQYHYLLVDFSGQGRVIARALGGGEIDRVSLTPPAPPDVAETTGQLRFWRAGMGENLSLAAQGRLGNTVRIAGGAQEIPGELAAQIFVTERGLAGRVHGLAAAGTESISFQGYDGSRQAWSYLQGGSLVIPAHGPYRAIALVSLNGADLSPLDVALPVLHWPLAELRAGISRDAGALMLLRGRRDFEFAPDAARVLAKWRWGRAAPGVIASEQRARQWSVMTALPEPERPRRLPFAELIAQTVRAGRPDAFLLQRDEQPPVVVLVHWPEWRILAVVAGESLADGTAPLFFSTRADTTLRSVELAGVPALRVGRVEGEPIHLPLARPVGSR